eukprot:CAMPEP_0180831506 /NCGR_PEP_ID=MMETSP1038_2-20121128/76359_1 /TAXON_ID=632150 /ORGANISM="Azadinium spinosum, Strain 3D9" /LENGTH=91 /DNA_ID=CAMNT_0022874677 /DNA_START=36 /DNA_END=308 /DNA_ORIENTATION=+
MTVPRQKQTEGCNRDNGCEAPRHTWPSLAQSILTSVLSKQQPPQQKIRCPAYGLRDPARDAALSRWLVDLHGASASSKRSSFLKESRHLVY